jgi:hypothetical protein
MTPSALARSNPRTTAGVKIVAEVPEWLVEGAEVVEYQAARMRTRGSAHLTPARVVKVGKRDVVLDNGHRYNLNHSLRIRLGTWDGYRELLSADDPKVALANAANRMDRAKSEVAVAHDAWRSVQSLDAAADLRLAIMDWETARARYDEAMAEGEDA